MEPFEGVCRTVNPDEAVPSHEDIRREYRRSLTEDLEEVLSKLGTFDTGEGTIIPQDMIQLGIGSFWQRVWYNGLPRRKSTPNLDRKVEEWPDSLDDLIARSMRLSADLDRTYTSEQGV